MTPKSALEDYFEKFRLNTIGQQQTFQTPFGEKTLIYADWTATGRAYQPIEDVTLKEIMPFLGNTHTAATITGTLMSKAYQSAKNIIKQHVNASGDDVLIFCGSGMTGAVNKLQRILGLRAPERLVDYLKEDNLQIDEQLRPIVFITSMEHNSNQDSWMETIATVEIIACDEVGNVDLNHFYNLLQQYRHRLSKIAAVTACSNVTGIETPYREIAKMIHEQGGLCFVDFAGSAPYVDINMLPAEKGTHLDAVYFSPHKFLGGAGTPGVLVFNQKIYENAIPDQPGGGTLIYTNPWKGREYVTDIEQREDGGTPPFLQGIKAAMCIKLKEGMGVENILRREQEMLKLIFERFSKIKNVEILQGNVKKRMGIISFIICDAHYNLIVKLLNDRFGIQTRGGCSCAGTYGHQLLNVSREQSYKILDSIRSGDLSCKPGWVRLSIHPIMTNAEIDFIMDAIKLTASNFEEWGKDYAYDAVSNEYYFKGFDNSQNNRIEGWFNFCSRTAVNAF